LFLSREYLEHITATLGSLRKIQDYWMNL